MEKRTNEQLNCSVIIRTDMFVKLYLCRICTGSLKSEDCQEALGMETGAISDEQITASSEWSYKHAATHGRLRFTSSSVRGAWKPRKFDGNQWLQVDLRSSFTLLTGVATQGRSDTDHWVTKYKLRYSDDGVNFQDYKEPGQTTAKVIQ